MNEFQDLETELLGLRPIAPRREVALRIERRLTRRIPGAAWAALPIAAALAVAALWGGKPAAPSFAPVAAADVLFSTRDDGYVLVDGVLPARRFHEAHVDTVTWRNPRGASLSWSIPREEVRIIPVTFQ